MLRQREQPRVDSKSINSTDFDAVRPVPVASIMIGKSDLPEMRITLKSLAVALARTSLKQHP